MMLTSPVTTEAAVDRLLALWREAVVALLASASVAAGTKESRP
jgi:hypothetical protein